MVADMGMEAAAFSRRLKSTHVNHPQGPFWEPRTDACRTGVRAREQSKEITMHRKYWLGLAVGCGMALATACDKNDDDSISGDTGGSAGTGAVRTGGGPTTGGARTGGTGNTTSGAAGVEEGGLIEAGGAQPTGGAGGDEIGGAPATVGGTAGDAAGRGEGGAAGTGGTRPNGGAGGDAVGGAPAFAGAGAGAVGSNEGAGTAGAHSVGGSTSAGGSVGGSGAMGPGGSAGDPAAGGLAEEGGMGGEAGGVALASLPAWSRCDPESVCEEGSHCWDEFPETSYCAPDCDVPGEDCAAVPGSAATPRCGLTSSTVNGCNIRCALSDAGTKGDCPGDLVCVDEGGIGLCEVGAGG